MVRVGRYFPECRRYIAVAYILFSGNIVNIGIQAPGFCQPFLQSHQVVLVNPVQAVVTRRLAKQLITLFQLRQAGWRIMPQFGNTIQHGLVLCQAGLRCHVPQAMDGLPVVEADGIGYGAKGFVFGDQPERGGIVAVAIKRSFLSAGCA